MYDVQYVTISMCRLDVGKTIKNVINILIRMVPGWVTGAASDVQGKDDGKCHFLSTLNHFLVSESRVGSW